MQTNTCQIEDHNQGEIISICFDKYCQRERACCELCLKQFHNGHIKQIVPIEDILNFQKTGNETRRDSSSDVSYALQELTLIQNYLDTLQKLVLQEIKRLNSQNCKQIRNEVGNQYNLLNGQFQDLKNKQWSEFVQDILKDFQVQDSNIILKDSIENSFGQSYSQFIDKFQEKLTEVENIFKRINQVVDQQVKEINFEKFIENKLFPSHNDTVYTISICNQRNLLASGSDDMTMKLWNLENNALIKSYICSEVVLDVVFSNQGNLIAFGGGGDCSIKLIDISDLKKENIISKLNGHKGNINRLIFSNDAKYLISGSSDKIVKIWNCQSKKEEFQLNSESSVYGVAINADGTLIASNSDDGNIRIWYFSNQILLCSQSAHKFGKGIQFSNNHKMLVSSDADGCIKLWNLDELNQNKLILIREFKTGKSAIWTVQFSICSRFIISLCNADIEIIVIEQSTGKIVQNFKSKQEYDYFYFPGLAISQNMDTIAYGNYRNVVVCKIK